MIRSFKYRLYPTAAQERALEEWLRLGRELYNAALQERRDAWKRQRKSVRRADQEKVLPEIRAARPEFGAIPIAVQRGWLRVLDRAFQAFFRRCKSGETPGFPRFRGRGRFESIAIDDLGINGSRGHLFVAGGKRVSIPLLGKIRFKQHRPIQGTPKALRIRRETGRWWICIQCADVSAKPLPATGRDVGIDLGLTHLATTSSGLTFENPRALKNSRLETERAQRRVSRRKKGSHRRRKAARILARKYACVANVRREAAITMARAVVRDYDHIYVEDLNIKRLARGMLAKAVHDAGWSTHSLHWLRVKAEEAARTVDAGNPAGTTIDCSECGEPVPKGLGVRIHVCPRCGLRLDRDVNAARNIQARGRRVRREALQPETSTTREDDMWRLIAK